MGEQMTFPNTWEEYEEFYGFTDSKKVYSNGARLIHSFRVEQWLDHKNVHGEWLHEQLIPNNLEGKMYGECSVCHKVRIVDNFCPNCGADMRGVK